MLRDTSGEPFPEETECSVGGGPGKSRRWRGLQKELREQRLGDCPGRACMAFLGSGAGQEAASFPGREAKRLPQGPECRAPRQAGFAFGQEHQQKRVRRYLL